MARSDAWRDRRVELAQGDEAAGMQETLFGVGGRRAGKQVVEGGAQAVDVAAGVGVAGVSAVLLQGRIGHGAASLHDGHGAGVVGLHDLDEAEVDQLDDAVRRHFDVAGLDVAVQDGRVLAVQVFERIHELVGPAEHLVLAQVVAALLLFAQISWRVRPSTKSMTRYSRLLVEK